MPTHLHWQVEHLINVSFLTAGQMGVSCRMWICAPDAEPVSALAHSRSLLSTHGHKHQDPAKSAWESRTKRNRDTVFAQVSRPADAVSKGYVILAGCKRRRCNWAAEMCHRLAQVQCAAFSRLLINILVPQRIHGIHASRHSNLVSQWTARVLNSKVFRPMLVLHPIHGLGRAGT